MPGLAEVLSSLTAEADGWRLESAEGWTQGRTLFGGMTTAVCGHAAGLTFPDLPTLRSAQVTFVGPAAGPLRVEARELRRGRSATIIGVDALAETGLAARATFSFGAARESAVVHDQAAAPAAPSPDACEPFMPGRDGQGFFQNFEMRLAGGSRPMTGGEPRYLVWVRLKDPVGVEPVTGLLAIADSLPPSAMAVFPQPAPISTMSWSVDLFPPARADGWCLLSSESEQAAEGYSLQAMSLWDESGRRLAVGRQVVAIFA